ncbi:MAG: lipopolysaccharide kinase InaA family protein [Candidatus Tectimicrobiota bacterium]
MRLQPVLPYSLQPFRAGRARGLAHPQLVAFFQALVRQPQPPASPTLAVYREHPNLVQEVWLPQGLELPWPRAVVKRFGWRGRQHYLFSPFKRSRAMKAYRTACHLLAHGLLTPVPLGVCEERRWGFVRYNVYATEALSEAMTLQQYCEAVPEGAAGLEEVMRLVAAYTRRMHDSGLWHRDLVSSNVLLRGPAGQRQVYVVDLNRARRLPYMPALLRAIDLARLGWREHLPRFCALYSVEGLSVPVLLWWVQLYGSWRAWRWQMRRLLGPVRKRLHL